MRVLSGVTAIGWSAGGGGSLASVRLCGCARARRFRICAGLSPCPRNDTLAQIGLMGLAVSAARNRVIDAARDHVVNAARIKQLQRSTHLSTRRSTA